MLTKVTTNPGCRVLVAEDLPELSAVIRQLIVAQNYKVVGTVEDGARVLEAAARLQPEIILLDVLMPNMDGIDVCRELTHMLPRTRTIALVADPDLVGSAAPAAGAFAFVELWELETALLLAVRSACDELGCDAGRHQMTGTTSDDDV